MVSRKFVFLLLVSVLCISAMLLCYAGEKQQRAATIQPLDDRVYRSQDMMQQKKVPRRHSKITVPAEVSLDLADSSKPGGPVTILVSASSLIPVGLGTVTLKVPPVGEIPAETQMLWSGTPSDFVAESAEYVVDALPTGKYHFAAIFEFTPDRENAGKLFASKALYLDVRPEKILSSNVSFDQIKRVELWEELEQRVMMELKADSTNVRLKTVSRDIKAAEPIDSDVIAKRIAELKASDPDVARRIMELNRIKAAPAGEPESVEQSEQSQPDVKRRRVQNRPVMERAVPIPERFRAQ